MDDPAFEIETDTTTQEILLAASNHDLPALKPLLRLPGAASVQDSETGYTPLHSAIASCEDSPSPEDIEAAKATIKELFLSGAIWNDLDMNNETPGCLAWRLGRKELYEQIVDAGVRAEILMNLMGGYEELSDGGEDGEEEEVEKMETSESAESVVEREDSVTKEPAEETKQEHKTPKKDVNSADYLQSKLEFNDDKLLDADANGVMMAWETSIMQRTVDLLIPQSSPPLRILNIGFGMGIIDTMFASTSPASHHIIEAHPDVLARLQTPGHKFGKEWDASAPEMGSYKIHAGRWQEILPTLIEENLQFDVIYFDTFGESYMELKMFFSEYVIGLLSENGKFSFFNGLGADRKVCYDVYTKVAELDLCDAGLDVDWTEVDVEELGGEGEGEWEGVRRRYWVLDKYRLPICGFMG